MLLPWYQKPRYVVLGLLCVFVLPMLLAWFMVSHRIYWGTVHHGYLIQPPIDLSRIVKRSVDKRRSENKYSVWWLVYQPKANCAQRCMDQLHQMRQINIALGKKRLQLQRALLLYSGASLPAAQRRRVRERYAGTHLWSVHAPTWQRMVMPKLPKKLALQPGALYLIDPKGQLLLVYADDVAGKAVLHDLNRLLKVSK
jgi:hypothetical protein